jgi:hypothetical protein
MQLLGVLHSEQGRKYRMNEPIPNKLRIEYKKSQSFRVIHADGAYGGTTPRLQLFIAFYNERFPIPQVLTYETSATGAPEREIISERESKEGIFREVEVGVTLDVTAAKGFLAWLTEHVSELEKTRERVLAQPEKPAEEVQK